MSTPLLNEIIEEAYVLFAPYKAVRPLDVCTFCCMELEDEGRLAMLPVRDIPLELLTEYNDAAKPDKTTVTEIKHFLPRYLELIAAYQFPSYEITYCFDRLIPFDRNEWTADELALLANFSKEYFKESLSFYPEIPLHIIDDIKSIFVLLWQFEHVHEELLVGWEESESLGSLLWFSSFYHDLIDIFRLTRRRTKVRELFMDECSSFRLNTWFEDPKTKKLFAERIFNLLISGIELDENIEYELDNLYGILSR